MPNAHVNKVVYGSNTLIDLTADTVTPATLMQGYTAHDASGALITGTASGGGTGGNVWQDAQGYVHLDDEGGGSSVTVEPLSVTQNGTYTAPSGTAYSPVTVNVSGGGDSGDRGDPIRFFDYDGTLVASYTSVPASLPSVPTHSKLTNGTWNYTLAQVAAQFAATGTCDVGANYDTASGKTEIDVVFEDASLLSPYLAVCPNGTVTVDWGDGSATETMTGTSYTSFKYLQHEYAATGSYTISLDGNVGFYYSSPNYSAVLRDTAAMNNRRVYASCVREVRVGAAARVGPYSFASLRDMGAVSLPASLTSIGNNAFYNCYSLASVSIPYGVTSVGSSVFQGCYAIDSIAIPVGVTSIGNNAFQYCYALDSIAIPGSVTSVGSSAFNNCCSLTSVNIPDGVTSVGSSTFYNCYSLASIAIPAGVTSIGNYAFYNCYSLASVSIPYGVTSIGNNALAYCYSLASVSIPDSVTSIDNNAFSSCYAITSVTIPAGVTSIGTQAFYNGYSVLEYHLEPTTPPTLAGTNAFSGIVAGTKIYVPQGCLEAYQTATNWSTYASYMEEEPS